MTVKNILRTLLLLVIVTFTNCERENLTTEIDTENLYPQKPQKVQVKKGDEVSKSAISFLKQKTNNTLRVSIGRNKVLLSKGSLANRESALGTVNVEKEIVVYNDDNTKHTFKVESVDQDENSVTNIIVVETETTTYEYFLKYNFDDGIPYDYASGTLNLSEFNGSIETYNSDGVLTGTMTIANGEVIDSQGTTSPCPDDEDPEEPDDDDGDTSSGGSTGGGGANAGDGTDTSVGGSNGGGWFDDAEDDDSCGLNWHYDECNGGAEDIHGPRPSGVPGGICSGSILVITDCNGNVIGSGRYASREGIVSSPCGGETGVIIDVEVHEKNCDELNKLFEPPNYVIMPPNKSTKVAITDLKNDMAGAIKENGFSFKHNGSSLQANAQPLENNRTYYNRVIYHNFPNVYGGFHLHQDNGKKTPMFGGNDIKVLYEFSQQYNNGSTVDNSLFVHGLVTIHGVYAIKINDLNKLSEISNIFESHKKLSAFTSKYSYKMNRLANSQGDIQGSPTDYQKAFLEFIQELDLGISLYKADDNLTQWNRLELAENPNSINNGITSFPCN